MRKLILLMVSVALIASQKNANAQGCVAIRSTGGFSNAGKGGPTSDAGMPGPGTGGLGAGGAFPPSDGGVSDGPIGSGGAGGFFDGGPGGGTGGGMAGTGGNTGPFPQAGQGLWSFDDCSADRTELLDGGFFAHTAFRAVTAACVPGVMGQGVAINESDDVIYVPDQPSFPFENGVTVAPSLVV